jgi:hypothetical protein
MRMGLRGLDELEVFAQGVRNAHGSMLVAAS